MQAHRHFGGVALHNCVLRIIGENCQHAGKRSTAWSSQVKSLGE
jgi:hypothetical protein